MSMLRKTTVNKFLAWSQNHPGFRSTNEKSWLFIVQSFIDITDYLVKHGQCVPHSFSFSQAVNFDLWWASLDSLPNALSRRACGFQNLVWTPIQGGHNLPPLVDIGLRWLPKLGVDMSPRPHIHRRACDMTLVKTS